VSNLFLEIAKIHGFELKSIDFIVLAFPQLEPPIGFQPTEDPACLQHYVLELKNNLYGLKQASFIWYKKLSND
jgi:hypothetical protein